MEFIALAICMLDMSGLPHTFRLDEQQRQVLVRKDAIRAMMDNPAYEGLPCVRINVGGQKIYVLGPVERLERELEEGSTR